MAVLSRYFAAVIISIAFFLQSLASAQPVSLSGAEFGYSRTVPLSDRIGSSAPRVRNFLRTGGVALTQTARGLNGWAVKGMKYDPAANDGNRWIVVLAKDGRESLEFRPRAFDWEIVPVARFVATPDDAAFTYFGEYAETGQPSKPGARPVGYHPAFINTLLGLRLMQLDLLLFAGPEYLGYFRSADGKLLLGAGERSVFPNGFDGSTQQVDLSKQRNIQRLLKAHQLMLNECRSNPSPTCTEDGQPHTSYIVGDTLTSVNYDVIGGRIQFQSGGICWDFVRPAAASETFTTEVITERIGRETVRMRRLTDFSRTFCDEVFQNLEGIHPLVYRASRRAMWFSALMREMKAVDPAQFTSFVTSLTSAIAGPDVQTPTELIFR